MLINNDSLQDVADGIHNHENFTMAAKIRIENLAQWRSRLGGFNKIVSSHARNYVVNCVLFLHFEAEGEGHDKGATFERLMRFCEERGCCGPRVLRTVLMLALTSGHLSVQPGRFDRRLKIFQPTEKLLAQASQFYNQALDCLDLLVEDRSLCSRSARPDRLIARVMSTAGRSYFEECIPVAEHYEDLFALFKLDGGYATVVAMADAQLRGLPLPNYKEVAELFRFSASQSRKILRLAEELDLVVYSPDRRVVDASALARVFKCVIARELALYAKYTLGLGPYFQRDRHERRPVANLEKLGGVHRGSEVVGW